jgi:[ribosomal protein S18]-alanine N-acetyltransferase
MNASHDIRPLDRDREAKECATLLITTEPWITLRLTKGNALATLSDPAKEVYALRDANGIAGFVILDMRGLVRGYIQTVCVRSDRRGQGLGSSLLRFAEDRIFRDSANAFICCSSFNPGARRLYERLGFEYVGVLYNFIVPGHDEILLRKTRGPWTEYRR